MVQERKLQEAVQCLEATQEENTKECKDKRVGGPAVQWPFTSCPFWFSKTCYLYSAPHRNQPAFVSLYVRQGGHGWGLDGDTKGRLQSVQSVGKEGRNCNHMYADEHSLEYIVHHGQYLMLEQV